MHALTASAPTPKRHELNPTPASQRLAGTPVSHPDVVRVYWARATLGPRTAERGFLRSERPPERDLYHLGTSAIYLLRGPRGVHHPSHDAGRQPGGARVLCRDPAHPPARPVDLESPLSVAGDRVSAAFKQRHLSDTKRSRGTHPPARHPADRSLGGSGHGADGRLRLAMGHEVSPWGGLCGVHGRRMGSGNWCRISSMAQVSG